MNIGGRLKFARERAGLTGTQVKGRTGIGESSLSEFESGKRPPSISQLQALAKAYHSSVASLLEGEAVKKETVLWRMKPGKDAEDLESRFLRLCEQYHNLEVWTQEKRPSKMLDVDGDPKTFDYSDAERLAKRVRDALVLGDRPGKALLSDLEEIWNVKVFHLDFKPTGSAASAVSEIFGAAVLLNSNNVPWRRTFDLAHELFHLLTFKIFHSGMEDSPAHVASRREERLATCFARHLLMPVEVAKAACDGKRVKGKVPLNDLVDIARQFDVSVEALIYHLDFIYNPAPHDDTDIKTLIEKAQRLSAVYESREKSPAPKWPDRYHDLAVKALRKGEMSIGRFAEYLSISRQDAIRYLADETLDGEAIELTPA
jgi:Zn-dependent peptidase ImmA (M78 family)